jgi:hypothetical protein
MYTRDFLADAAANYRIAPIQYEKSVSNKKTPETLDN